MLLRDGRDEKDHLIGFVLLALDFVRSRPPAACVRLLPPFPKPVDRSRSLGSLRKAASQAVKLCSHLEPQEVTELDHRLTHAGFPPLSSMRIRAYRWLLPVLSEGKLQQRSCKLVQKLSESESMPLSPRERERLKAIVREHAASGA